MQRYRVNYTLLVVLLVGVLVCSGAVYGLWRYQVERKAGSLVEQADKAKAEDKLREEEQYLRNYLTVRPDDREVEVRWANVWAEIGENEKNLENWTFKEYQSARQVMETTLRKYSDEQKLRRRLVDLTLKFGFGQKEALAHLKVLLNGNPKDAELLRIQSTCMFQNKEPEALDNAYVLIGYDKGTDTFDVSKATAPGETAVYRGAAQVLRGTERRPELADRVMNQLVEANPEKVEAYLQRASYRRSLDEAESAKEDLKKAYEIDPNSADALAANIEMQLLDLQEQRQEKLKEDSQASLSDEDLAACRALLEAGVAAHPEDIRFYQHLASLEVLKNDAKKAIEHLELGLTKIDERFQYALYEFMANLYLSQQDMSSARKTGDKLREVGNSVAADYIEANCLLAEEKWFPAHEMLKQFKSLPQIDQRPEMLTRINFQLGLCNEKLGDLDLAISAYKLALESDPNNVPAQAGVARIEGMLGPLQNKSTDVDLSRMIADMKLRPKDEQDWSEINKKVEEQSTKHGLTGAAKTLLKVHVLMQRGDYVAAREMIREAYKQDPDNLNVRRAAMLLVSSDPEQGPSKALELHQSIVEKFGDTPQLRMDRADLLIALSNLGSADTSDATLKNQLMTLTEGTQEWENQQQVQLWSALGAKFLSIRLRDEAETCWKKVTELAPGDLATRVMLFKMAREENDDVGMKQAQDAILEIVRSEQNSTWIYTEAQRLLSQVARGQAGAEALQQAEALVTKALLDRPDWNELYLLQAEIELNRRDEAAALESYDKAMKLGRGAPINLLQYAQLLIRRGRWVDARAALEMLDRSVLQRSFGQQYADVLLNTGDKGEALKTADVVIETDAENAAKQHWYGQFVLKTIATDKKFEVKAATANPDPDASTEDQFTLTVESASMTPAERQALAEQLTKAGKGLEKAVRLAPRSPDVWLTWVGFLRTTMQLDRAAEAIRQVQLSLPEDELPLVLARCYEITGRWFDAENRYRAAMENNPDDVRAMRFLAAYYLGNGYPIQANKLSHATPLINRILKAATEGKAEPQDENVLWARRTAAEILAQTGDYQKLLKAERLLASNAVGGELAVEDQLRMARILAPRPEPISRLKAVALLSALKQNQPLAIGDDMILGKLYFLTSKWDQARPHMVELIARYPDAEAPRGTFIQMLLDRGGTADLAEATRQLNRLAEVAPTAPSTMELVARLAIKTGKQAEARSALRRLLPADLSQLSDDSIPAAARVAELITELKDYDTAEQLYRIIASKKPEYIPQLATFLGVHRDAEKGFELLDQLQGQLPAPALIQSGLSVLRTKREDLGDRFDPQVQAWLDRALRDDPEGITLQLQQAELHDLGGKYEAAAAMYRKLLERSDVEGQARAIVLNNLAFLLALGGAKETSSGEAYKLVQEAVQIIGPTSDILDTRAVVFLAQKQYPEAIADLELAVIDGPTASKWYHKALAHLQANDGTNAELAWKQALALGLDRTELNHMEWDQYEKTKEKIENPELRSASL
ncbi:MAG: tetratricopeptide repeat protein [Pirellulales bacterium]